MTLASLFLQLACTGDTGDKVPGDDGSPIETTTDDSGHGTDGSGTDDSGVTSGKGDDSGTKGDDSGSGSTSDDSGTSTPDDADGDGWTVDVDCDDGDPTVYPSAPEACDELDNDCNGAVDDGIEIPVWYQDGDGDGFGVDTATLTQCSRPDGYAVVAGDCDDVDGTVNPSALEACNDIDDDCDTLVDDDVTYVLAFDDLDGDGFGTGTGLLTCDPPAGTATLDGDCDDADAAVSPGAYETCNEIDDDCDGTVDDGVVYVTSYVDADADGYGTGSAHTSCTLPAGSVTASGDCDDADDAVSPGALESCNYIDDDCDGSVDDGMTFVTEYVDADADGYGAGSAKSSCVLDSGYSTKSTDCNDASTSVNPGATEVCNFTDDDCDSTVDDGITYVTEYKDLDGDGYGAGTSKTVCTLDSGYSTKSTDCNDASTSVNPGATEVCNFTDDDCDSTVDDGITYVTEYKDLDGDGYGAGTSKTACTLDSGYSTKSTDCNDSSATVSPGATESCNYVDDDCDTVVDDGMSFVTEYKDVDGDGYGAGASKSVCTLESGYSTKSTDCNDSSSAVSPGATETCNYVDDDCDTVVDDGMTFVTEYKDVDADGYGAGASKSSCALDSGYSKKNTDCNDSDKFISPGATESCNYKDDDCDGTVDDGMTFVTEYLDGDADGYGAGASKSSCALDSGYSTKNTDCNDSAKAINPGATETCNSIDDDCDLSTDEGVTVKEYVDADGDSYGSSSDAGTSVCTVASGYSSSKTDCNDSSSAIHPGATETCDYKDDDCDGSTDEGMTFVTEYVDGDADGYGAGSSKSVCTLDSGYSTKSTDCNDTNSTVHPGATETCNSVDDDCDASTDEGVTVKEYVDADADGYGSSSDSGKSVCTVAVGYSSKNTDCNDANASVSPAIVEVCNSIDDDCDASVDEGLTLHTYYTDADHDTYGTGSAIVTCKTYGVGYADDDDDCDDVHAAVNPSKTEVCNDGFDTNCDGDEGSATVDCLLADVYDVEDSGSLVTGTATDDQFGTVVRLGDLNADGKDDVVVMSPNAGTGTVYAFLDAPGASTHAFDADVTYTANKDGDLTDGDILVADFDGDGNDDLAVGTTNKGTTSTSDDGSVHIQHGPFDYGDALTYAMTGGASGGDKISYAGEAGHIGTALAEAGDVDDDGFADFLVGTDSVEHDGISVGAAFLLSGPVSAMDLADATASMFGTVDGGGTDLTFAGGDLNGDGYAEIAIGRPGMSETDVFEGPVTGEVSFDSADWIINDVGFDEFGSAVQVVSDQDGDGYGELLVGGPGIETSTLVNVGSAYLWSGEDFVTGATPDLSSAVATWMGDDDNEHIGLSLSTGDVDGDGSTDFLLPGTYCEPMGTFGACAASSSYSNVYLSYGPVSGTISIGDNSIGVADAKWISEGGEERLGLSIATGDVDADGKADILMGAQWWDDTTHDDAGRVYLWMGLGY